MSYEELLIERIPEAFQDSDEVERYLRVAGRLFDEYVAAIERFDGYRDYSEVEADRLRNLALNFGMSFPRSLDEQTQRMIIRDIHDIYSRVGVRDFMNWIFKIIGWTVSIESAWLPNPDYFDSSIADIHNIDRIGEKKSNFKEEQRNLDYSLFYIGETFIATSYAEGGEGNVYFRGRKFFDDYQTIDKLQIVGEDYDPDTEYRTDVKLGSTPYLFVTVLKQDYSVFDSGYTVEEVDEDGGISDRKFIFTKRELLNVVEGILSYYILEEFRPTNIRVVVLAKEKRLDDDMIVDESFSTIYVNNPLEVHDRPVITGEDVSRLDHVIKAGSKFLAGAPPHGFGAKMSITPSDRPKLINKATFNNLSVELETPYNLNSGGPYLEKETFDFQPIPMAGTEEFAFYTPDREQYDFRLVFNQYKNFIYDHEAIGTLDQIYNFPYPRDNDSLILNVDFLTDSYGVGSSIGGANLSEGDERVTSTQIIVRSPTTITSPNFRTNEPIEREYMVGRTNNGGESFESNFLLFGSFEEDFFTAQEEEVTFTYFYDMKVYTKGHDDADGEGSLESYNGFFEYMENPTKGDLENISDVNTVLFLPSIKLGFDFVVDVKYLEMPVWSNDPRNEDS